MTADAISPKRYTLYKESGVPWLGQVPEHWRVIPNKFVMHLRKATVGEDFNNYTLLSLTKQGVIPRNLDEPTGKFPESFDTYQAVEPGDLVFCLFDVDETPRTIGIAKQEGMVTGAYTRFVCTNETTREFTFLLYLSLDDQKALKPLYTGLRKVITKESFLGAKIALPPLEEQAAIVRYLDDADQRIQAYVSAKERLIALLGEERQAIIHQAVTRGLDPDVRLKPSGVEWLGDVPEHWEVRKLKQVCSQHAQYGANIPASEYTASGIRFLRTTDITQDGDVVGEGVYIPPDISPEHLLSTGDILLTRSGATIGQSFLYDAKKHGKCSFAGYLVRFSPNPEMLPRFIYLFTVTAGFQNPVQQSAITSTIDNVNAEKYANIHMPVPPPHEQIRIVQHLNELTGKVDGTIARARRQIQLMEEYRTRLIADVVTGKIDVSRS